jgi:hypothetical protein
VILFKRTTQSPSSLVILSILVLSFIFQAFLHSPQTSSAKGFLRGSLSVTTITMFSVLHVCADLLALEQGKRTHGYEIRMAIPMKPWHSSMKCKSRV